MTKATKSTKATATIESLQAAVLSNTAESNSTQAVEAVQVEEVEQVEHVVDYAPKSRGGRKAMSESEKEAARAARQAQKEAEALQRYEAYAHSKAMEIAAQLKAEHEFELNKVKESYIEEIRFLNGVITELNEKLEAAESEKRTLTYAEPPIEIIGKLTALNEFVSMSVGSGGHYIVQTKTPVIELAKEGLFNQ